MSTTPKIFSVFAFEFVGGKRRLSVHYVAGLSSADAESRIKARNATHLNGQCFITTDEHEDEHGDGCKLYATGGRNETDVPDHDFKRWVSTMTRPQWDEHDGTGWHPARFRRFHVEAARKGCVAQHDLETARAVG